MYIISVKILNSSSLVRCFQQQKLTLLEIREDRDSDFLFLDTSTKQISGPSLLTKWKKNNLNISLCRKQFTKNRGDSLYEPDFTTVTCSKACALLITRA